MLQLFEYRASFPVSGESAGKRDAFEHVPEKLMRFSDWNILQSIDFERFLLDRRDHSIEQKTLSSMCRKS